MPTLPQASVTPVPREQNWNSLRQGAKNFGAAVAVKTKAAIEAGKVQIKLLQEQSAITACRQQLEQLAEECGRIASSEGVDFSDPAAQAARKEACDAKQNMDRTKARRDEAAAGPSRIDSKKDPGGAAAATAQLKTMESELARAAAQSRDVNQRLGSLVLSAGSADPRFGEVFAQHDQLQRQIQSHQETIASLTQESSRHQAALGYDFKKVVIIAAVAPVGIVLLGALFLFHSNHGISGQGNGDAVDLVRAELLKHWTRTNGAWTSRFAGSAGSDRSFTQVNDLSFTVESKDLSDSDRLNGWQFLGICEFPCSVRVYTVYTTPQIIFGDAGASANKWSPWRSPGFWNYVRVHEIDGKWEIENERNEVLFAGLKPDPSEIPPG